MKLLILCFLNLTFSILNAQTGKFTISGYVKEEDSGEVLIGANISLFNLKIGAVTNNYGFYSLEANESDSIKLVASFVGYTSKVITTSFHSDFNLDFDLKKGTLLEEITISSDRSIKASESVNMSSFKVLIGQIKKVPSLLGEKDVLKVLQLMPGVQKGTEGNGGLYVRGGGPDQNLIILDDATVYNASHLFGFFSVFNGDALKSVELTKGGFPARFGGRLSSVLEMHMKEGNKEEWHGEGGLGLISARTTLEGPIQKGKSSILISGRRTFADLLTAPFLNKGLPAYYFYDLNAKINFDFGRNNKLYFSGYFGQDKYNIKTSSDRYRESSGYNWGNSTGTIRWNHLFTNKIFSNTSLIFTNYDFNINDKYYDIREDKNYFAEYHSGIRDISFKYDLDYILNPQHLIKAGIITINHIFNPYAFVEEDEMYETSTTEKTLAYGIESGFYAEDTWQVVKQLKLNLGLRISHFIAGKQQYLFPEPRINAAWRFNNDIAIKGSYSVMNQYIHLLSNTGINLPTNLWVPVTDKVKPQRSRQVAFGIVKDFQRDYSFSIEAYHKTMDHVIAYKEGSSFIILNDVSSAKQQSWEGKVTEGKSWSYGTELLFQKNSGRLTGWIGYTLSWTPMQFDSLNFGKKFYSRFDRRHDISIVGFYKLNNRITFSGSWVYGTGNAITLSNATYFPLPNMPDVGPGSKIFERNLFPSIAAYDYGGKNNFRMASYHRLDVGVQFRKDKKWGERMWEISVYNLYNRMNPFFYYSGTKIVNDKAYGVLKQVTLFPIIPSFSYNIKF